MWREDPTRGSYASLSALTYCPIGVRETSAFRIQVARPLAAVDQWTLYTLLQTRMHGTACFVQDVLKGHNSYSTVVLDMLIMKLV